MVPWATISIDFPTDRYDTRYVWFDLLRIPSNTAQLFCRPFGMAHGNGIEYYLFVA